jgi:hypothetical protein
MAGSVNTGWQPEYYYSRGMVYESSTFSWVAAVQATIENGNVNVSGPIAVTGTFWQASQTVEGTVDVGNFPSSQAVTGTFWQTTQPVSASSLPLPSGASTSANQVTLESLIDTLQELIQRLAPLASSINITGGIGLRVVGVGGSYAVTGPLTSAQHIANTLTLKMAGENLTAVQSNINNCTGA